MEERIKECDEGKTMRLNEDNEINFNEPDEKTDNLMRLKSSPEELSIRNN